MSESERCQVCFNYHPLGSKCPIPSGLIVLWRAEEFSKAHLTVAQREEINAEIKMLKGSAACELCGRSVEFLATIYLTFQNVSQSICNAIHDEMLSNEPVEQQKFMEIIAKAWFPETWQHWIK